MTATSIIKRTKVPVDLVDIIACDLSLLVLPLHRPHLGLHRQPTPSPHPRLGLVHQVVAIIIIVAVIIIAPVLVLPPPHPPLPPTLTYREEVVAEETDHAAAHDQGVDVQEVEALSKTIIVPKHSTHPLLHRHPPVRHPLHPSSHRPQVSRHLAPDAHSALTILIIYRRLIPPLLRRPILITTSPTIVITVATLTYETNKVLS